MDAIRWTCIMTTDVVCSKIADFDAWISLAREVELIFGPMADELSFQEALRQAISAKAAFCLRTDANEEDGNLIGGIVISKASNEIAWLVVSQNIVEKAAVES